jgi:pimeloyl-ACP methyl ester carboxylesterase
VRYHVREWGADGAPQLFLLHGWMDVSASFQFLVDALSADWRVIAPDWRGFGLTEWRGDAYWFPDYLGDLDAILRFYSPEAAVTLIGHSMGGNVACLYAGVRPARVRRLVALDAFGLADSDAGAGARGGSKNGCVSWRRRPQFGSFPSRARWRPAAGR